MGSSCCTYQNVQDGLTKFFTEYTIPKQVTLRSASLRVPQLLINLAVFLYIVVWQFGHQLHFLSVDNLDMQTNIKMKLPGKKLHHGDPDTDKQLDIKPIAEMAHCTPEYLAKTPEFLNITGCKYQDEFDMLWHVSDKNLFINTKVDQIHQVRCTLSDVSKCDKHMLWKKDYKDTYFIVGIDDAMLKIKHSALSDAAEEEQIHISNTPGFIEWHDGTLHRIPVKAKEDHHQIIPIDSARKFFNDSKTIKPCGLMETGGKACFGDHEADYISVPTLLASADIDLEKLAKGNKYNTRIQGRILYFEIEYLNNDPTDFWTWPYGLKRKYIYRVRQLPFEEFDWVNNKYVQYPVGDPNQRMIIRASGIRLILLLRGLNGVYSMREALLTFLTALTLFKVSESIVNMGLTQIYACSGHSGVQHATVMYNFYSTDKSPNQAEVDSILQDQGKVRNFRELDERHRYTRMQDAIHQATGADE